MLIFAGDFRSVFWFAVIPAYCPLPFCRSVSTKLPGRRASSPGSRCVSNFVRDLSAAYWWVVAAGAVFTLARFSEAFLLLRAQEQGLPDTYAPLVLVLMNAVFAVTAYPMGRLADSLDPRHLLAPGLLVLVAADVTLALSPNLATTAAGIALWGLHMGMTQGVLAALIARSAPPALRGTAFGVFYLGSASRC